MNRLSQFSAVCALALVGLVALAAAPEAQAQDSDACAFADIVDNFPEANRAEISLQIDNCNAKGWGAKKHQDFSSAETCHCDIKAWNSATGEGGCGPQPDRMPENYCMFGAAPDDNTQCRYYFGATLQYLPDKTDGNKDSCFASHCPDGLPSAENMNGATLCTCPDSGEVYYDGTCTPMNEYLCIRSGWGYDMSEDSCAIRVTLSGSGTVSAECYMSGSKTPQCATVFGSNENIPPDDGFEGFPGSKDPAIYNCDPLDQTGQIPATINTISAVECGCPLREALNNDGVCELEQCEAGMTIFVDPAINYSGCNDENQVAIAEDGRAKGWGCHITESTKTLHCDIFIHDYSAGEDGPARLSACTITSPAAHNFCGKFFGWPPQFPTATGDEEEDKKHYAANCDKGGEVPGAIPATINTIGAKACGCDSAGGFVGDWPNCACPAGEGIRANGNCGACDAGEEVLADGTCGAEYEVVYSYFPATLSARVDTFAITPEDSSVIRLGLPLIGGALRATLEAGQTIRLHLSTKPVSVSVSSNGFCEVEFSGHGTANGAYTNCDVVVTSDINIELYLLPTVAGTPPPPRRVRAAGLADPADGTGGTVAVGGEVSAGGWADAGALVTFTATPAEGWYVGDWEGEGGRCQAVGDRDTTGAAGEQTCALAADDDLLVTANFARPGAGFTVVFSHTPATLALAPTDLAIVAADGGDILATLSGGRAEARNVEANSQIHLFLQNAPAGYGVESVSLDECRAQFTGFHGGLPEPGRGPERGPSSGGQNPCVVRVNHNLNIVVAFAPLADCEENNLSLIEAVDGPRVFNRLLCGECPEASPPALPTHRRAGDYCVPLSGDFGTLSDKALCGIFGGNMDEDAAACSGMDGNDTFCIMDAEEADGVRAFPCRGLFKHLRSCNLEFNRPALNPFFCGERCATDEQAVGGGCR